MTDLKPCPFCGGKANLKDYQIEFRVMCPECGGRANLCITAKEAAEAWNMRAETVKDQPDGDVVEVVRCKDCKHLKNGRRRRSNARA